MAEVASLPSCPSVRPAWRREGLAGGLGHCCAPCLDFLPRLAASEGSGRSCVVVPENMLHSVVKISRHVHSGSVHACGV